MCKTGIIIYIYIESFSSNPIPSWCDLNGANPDLVEREGFGH